MDILPADYPKGPQVRQLAKVLRAQVFHLVAGIAGRNPRGREIHA